jgi:23S rRNA U2552 (ribose-2'-O)-methylase RlmE/FtsJ
MPDSLNQIAARLGDPSDSTTKSAAGNLYGLYEDYLGHLADAPITLLELGVHKGHSLATFAQYFKNARIIGVDIADCSAHIPAGGNITFARADQSDAAALERICATYAPDGLDVVIDDASHVGEPSLASFRALFPRVKPGGFYFIEDWGTGYFPNWPDGAKYQPLQVAGTRITSHDFGMVGFVKSLVDGLTTVAGPSEVEFLTMRREFALVRKALVPCVEPPPAWSGA